MQWSVNHFYLLSSLVDVDGVATGDAKIENEFKSISQLKKNR